MMTKIGYGIVIIDSEPEIYEILNSYKFDDFCKEHGMTCTSWIYEDMKQFAILNKDYILCCEHDIFDIEKLKNFQKVEEVIPIVINELNRLVGFTVNIPTECQFHAVMAETHN